MKTYKYIFLCLAFLACCSSNNAKDTPPQKSIKYWTDQLYCLPAFGLYKSKVLFEKHPPPLHQRNGRIEQAIVSYGLKSFPVLIEKISSTKKSKNKVIPMYNTTEGDNAFLFIMHWTKGWLHPERYFDKEYFSEFGNQGLMSYFNYVSNPRNRLKLKRLFRISCGSTIEKIFKK